MRGYVREGIVIYIGPFKVQVRVKESLQIGKSPLVLDNTCAVWGGLQSLKGTNKVLRIRRKGMI